MRMIAVMATLISNIFCSDCWRTATPDLAASLASSISTLGAVALEAGEDIGRAAFAWPLLRFQLGLALSSAVAYGARAASWVSGCSESLRHDCGPCS
jgi:hypothetical protein